jgi:hypothetical protein
MGRGGGELWARVVGVASESQIVLG